MKSEVEQRPRFLRHRSDRKIDVHLVTGAFSDITVNLHDMF